jgi:hypothetical protein
LKPAITKALTSRDSYIKINHVEISEIKKNLALQNESIAKMEKDILETRKRTTSLRPSSYSSSFIDRNYGKSLFKRAIRLKSIILVDGEISKMNINIENRINHAQNKLQNTNYEIKRLRDIVDTYNARTNELQRQVTFQRRAPSEDEIARKLKILQDSQPRIRKLEQDNFDGQVKMRDMESRVFNLESEAKKIAAELEKSTNPTRSSEVANLSQNLYERILVELRRINDEIQDLKYSNSNLKLSISK